MTVKRSFPRAIRVLALVVVSYGVIILFVSWYGRFWFGRFQPPLKGEITGKDGAPMVLIPAGSFTMGSDDGEPNEKPVHKVYLNEFYIDKYEVTTSRYANFLEATGGEKPFKWNDVTFREDGDRPVVGVNWHEAQAYCRWAGKRLLTEAEWEKASRETDGRTYPWGNEEPTADRGNFNQGLRWRGYATLTVVGSFKSGKSPFGVFDLAGNVSEWTADWYDPSYYQSSPVFNPTGPAMTEKAEPYSLEFSRRKVVRGASWVSGPKGMRSAYRVGSAPKNRHGDVGFRCAGQPRVART